MTALLAGPPPGPVALLSIFLYFEGRPETSGGPLSNSILTPPPRRFHRRSRADRRRSRPRAWPRPRLTSPRLAGPRQAPPGRAMPDRASPRLAQPNLAGPYPAPPCRARPDHALPRRGGDLVPSLDPELPEHAAERAEAD